jgi:heterodisulfide reductase subunit A
MARLDETFPTNDCSMCIMSPRLVECGRHDNIEVLTGAELAGLSGEPGNFEATVFRHARMVDLDKCNSYGLCAQSCPQELPNEFDLGLSSRAAIFKRYPQAFPNAYAIDSDHCLGCGSCRETCPAGVIDLEMEDEELRLPVGRPGFRRTSGGARGPTGRPGAADPAGDKRGGCRRLYDRFDGKAQPKPPGGPAHRAAGRVR